MWVLILITGLLLGGGLAQNYGGGYTAEHAQGRLTLELTQQGDALTGTLTGGGLHFALEGFVYEAGAGGAVYTGEEMGGFEAYLQGDTLGLYLFELDAQGEPIAESATELLMTRQRDGVAPEGAANLLGAAQPGNPLAAQTPPADPLLGTFSDGSLTAAVEGGGTRYSGRLEFGGQSYPFTATGAGQEMQGTFQSGAQAFEFSAALQGETLTFVTGGTSYALTRDDAAPPGNPLAGGALDPVIVRGSHASLTEDNARAFIEALEFSLGQVGYAYRFTEAEKAQLLGAIIQEYPQADEHDQVVLAQAREIWTRVQAHWPTASEAEQREFVLGVFVLAFGAETVQAWAGPAGAGGEGQALGTGDCGSFEDCTSQFVDQGTWTDTFNAQGCWAAAGCQSYDSSSRSFTYSDGY